MANADVKALEDLAADMTRAKRQLISRLAERGYQLLRAEVPFNTGNLKQGVAPPEVDHEQMSAVLTVSARSARTGSREARVIGRDGKEKGTVTLRPRPAYNYASAVALGRPAISPKSGKALIIPVATAPSGEGYLISGGQIYVVRRSAGLQKENPFHERAAERLEGEAERIATAVLERFV